MVSSSNKQFKDLGDRSQSRRLCKKKRKLESIHNCAMLEIILSKLVVFASDHLNMKSLKLQAPWYFVLMETHQGTTPTLPIALLWNPMLPLLPAHTQQADLVCKRKSEQSKQTDFHLLRVTLNPKPLFGRPCKMFHMKHAVVIQLIVLPLRPASPFGDCRTPSATSSWSDTRNTLGSYQTLKIFWHPLYTCLLKLCLHSFYVFFCCGPNLSSWGLGLEVFLRPARLKAKQILPNFVWSELTVHSVLGFLVCAWRTEKLFHQGLPLAPWHQDKHNPSDWNTMNCDFSLIFLASVLKHAKHRVGILPPQQLALLWRRPVLPLQKIARISDGKSCHFQGINFHQDLHQASKVVKRSSPEWNAPAFDAPPCPPQKIKIFFPFRMMPWNQIWIAQIKCMMALSSHFAFASKRFSSLLACSEQLATSITCCGNCSRSNAWKNTHWTAILARAVNQASFGGSNTQKGLKFLA